MNFFVVDLISLLVVFAYMSQIGALKTYPFRPIVTAIECRSTDEIQLGIVTMYTKFSCPYCEKARSLLEDKHSLRISFVGIEEPDLNRRAGMLQQMRTFSGGRNTVPQIFFNAEHMGGYDDIKKLDEAGELAQRVATVKSVAPSVMMDHWYHPWY